MYGTCGRPVFVWRRRPAGFRVAPAAGQGRPSHTAARQTAAARLLQDPRPGPGRRAGGRRARVPRVPRLGTGASKLPPAPARLRRSGPAPAGRVSAAGLRGSSESVPSASQIAGCRALGPGLPAATRIRGLVPEARRPRPYERAGPRSELVGATPPKPGCFSSPPGAGSFRRRGDRVARARPPRGPGVKGPEPLRAVRVARKVGEARPRPVLPGRRRSRRRRPRRRRRRRRRRRHRGVEPE